MGKDKKQLPVGADDATPSKRELTAREEAQREKDCKVEYSVLIPGHMRKFLDEQRRASWIPPSEVEKMPTWTPVLQLVVDEVIEGSVKEVQAYMETEVRAEKEKVVEKLAGRVLKRLPGHDKELVEKRLWGSMHALKTEQGVSNKHLIGKTLAR